ncbi:succinate-acetate/proton symporter SatP [Clostridium acetireducens DSM 10703]|uniref:Succinate-acetate/proton symporter SatP n=1 Tax=Clostridium acetireducens DSM 10703 TaxID=1121290 RepID=A0A1E8EY96_9CLOT|nr:GPR1/FUN34/YaaH family transporter [Clostridium acetireducens]OFI05938.1 succinate-acetate/proton symporter SatP [Clostridium acetireducens DSM 10703]
MSSGNVSNEVKNIKITNSDPSAIGLFGLAMVTLVASSQKLGLTEGVAFVIPWAIFLGAFAQLFASIEDSKRGNTFGTTAFGGYAFFWFGMAMSWLIKLGTFGEKLASNVDGKQLGFAFLGYLIFTIFMTIGAAETHKVLFTIFVLIDLLFLGLTLNSFGIISEFSHKLAAYSELLISFFSFYGSAASVLNNHFEKVFLPVGKPLGIFKK